MRMFRDCVVVAALAAFAPAIGCGGEEPPPAAPQAPTPPLPPPPTEPVSAEPAPPPPKKSMVEMQKEAIGDALVGLNGQDPKKFASVYAEDGIITVAGLNEINGRAAVEQNMAEWFETF